MVCYSEWVINWQKKYDMQNDILPDQFWGLKTGFEKGELTKDENHPVFLFIYNCNLIDKQLSSKTLWT